MIIVSEKIFVSDAQKKLFLKSQMNQCQRSVPFYIETTCLIYVVNQMTNFSMKCNTGLKWAKDFLKKQ